MDIQNFEDTPLGHIYLWLGVFLVVVGSAVLALIGSGWAEITRLGLAEAFMLHVAICSCLLLSGLLMLLSARGPRTIKDILNWKMEQSSPLWTHLLGLLGAVVFFVLGYFSNPLAYFFILVIAIAMINDIKKLGLETGGHRWESLGKPLYLAVVVISTVYLAFQNVVYVLLSLGVFIAFAVFIKFTSYGETIKKHTIFQDKYITLIVIAVSIAIILLALIFREVL